MPRLREVLEEAEGWDIIHVSGHGAPGELLLETASGQPDRVAGADLADLLDLARERVKLVTVSACWSAAVTAGEQRRLLGLPTGLRRFARRSDDDAGDRGESASEALATEFAARLGCAVLAMRYPVGDEFAMALAGKLYELLAREGSAAAARGRDDAAAAARLKRLPGVSAATPALFGGRAVRPAPGSTGSPPARESPHRPR